MENQPSQPSSIQEQPDFPAPEIADPLVQSIETTIKGLATMRDLVKNFYDGAQKPFNEQMNGLIDQLQHVDSLRDSFNVKIPADVLNHIDKREGNNPVLYTKNRIDSTLQVLSENTKFIEKTKGSIKEFHDANLTEKQSTITEATEKTE